MVKIIDIKTRRVSVKYQGSPAEITQERDYDTGKILSRVRVARGTVEIMSMNGTLTPPQIQAADSFQATFNNSMLEPRYAKVKFDRVQNGYREFTQTEIDATKQVEQALEAIRPVGRELAYYVIGFGEKLSLYCTRRRNMQTDISYSTAKRLLLQTLDDLVIYYGY